MKLDMPTRIKNLLVTKFVTPDTDAPNTFRTAISFFLSFMVRLAMENIPMKAMVK